MVPSTLTRMPSTFVTSQWWSPAQLSTTAKVGPRPRSVATIPTSTHRTVAG